MKSHILKSWIIISVSFFIFNNLILANGNSSLFERANELYRNEQYDTAIVLYENILKSGFEAPELYYNLGNSYFKKKDIANAILNYERAHKLAPNDDEINFNLQLTQTMVVDKINALPEFFLFRWWKAFSEILSSYQWACLSIILFIIFLLSAIAYLFANRLWLKKISFWTGLILIFFSIIAFNNSYQLKNSNIYKSEAILISPSVTIKSSPDEKGTDLFVIHEGAKVWVIDEVGDWLKIKIADGNNGWLKKNDIEKI